MKNSGYTKTTLEAIGNRLRNLSKQVDMNNPEKIITIIMNESVENHSF